MGESERKNGFKVKKIKREEKVMRLKNTKKIGSLRKERKNGRKEAREN